MAVDGYALAVCGPSGSGKSGLAAQMIAMGASLVADDLCVLRRDGVSLSVERPPGRPALLELRGLGIVTVRSTERTHLAALLFLIPSTTRLPDPEPVTILEVSLPLLRHPYRFDLAAKAIAWLRGGGDHKAAVGSPPPFN